MTRAPHATLAYQASFFGRLRRRRNSTFPAPDILRSTAHRGSSTSRTGWASPTSLFAELMDDRAVAAAGPLDVHAHGYRATPHGRLTRTSTRCHWTPCAPLPRRYPNTTVCAIARSGSTSIAISTTPRPGTGTTSAAFRRRASCPCSRLALAAAFSSDPPTAGGRGRSAPPRAI